VAQSVHAYTGMNSTEENQGCKGMWSGLISHQGDSNRQRKDQPAVPIQESNLVTFAKQLAFPGLLHMLESSSCQSTTLLLL